MIIGFLQTLLAHLNYRFFNKSNFFLEVWLRSFLLYCIYVIYLHIKLWGTWLSYWKRLKQKFIDLYSLQILLTAQYKFQTTQLWIWEYRRDQSRAKSLTCLRTIWWMWQIFLWALCLRYYMHWQLRTMMKKGLTDYRLIWIKSIECCCQTEGVEI